MAEEKKKEEMIELSPDALDAVTGGMSVAAGAGMMDWVIDKVTGLVEAKAAAPSGAEQDPVDAAGSADRTTMAQCPVCGTMTKFLVYSGGRMRCTVCQTIKSEL
ncbi:MAG: hypothetical protein J6N77_01260 [Lachnospiraceae bacterium]|nr:hypothetical protein [Lachnospiraceae bacterium]